MKKLLFLLFSCFCCICSVCAQAQTVLYYEQLLDSACVYLENNLIGEGETMLLDLEENQEAPERIRLNATLVLANLYVNLGEADRLQESLLILDDYLQQHPEREDIVEAYRKYEEIYSSLALYGPSFTERMCGLWVSPNCDEYGIPSIAVYIGQNSTGKYVARIIESCSLAMFLSTRGIYEEHKTLDLDFFGEKRKLQLFFGDEKLRKGDAALAAAGVAATNQLTRSAGQAISAKNRKNTNSVGNAAGHAAVDLGGVFLQGLFTSMAVEKKYVKILEIDMQETMPDMVSAALRYEYRLQRSDGRNVHEKQERLFNLYKVTAADSIFFTTRSYNKKEKKRYCFGCPANSIIGYSEEQAAILDKLRSVSLLQEREDVYRFNQDAYKRLHRKIVDKLTSLPEEDLEKAEKDIAFDFKYAVLNQVPGEKLPMFLIKLKRKGFFTGICQQVCNTPYFLLNSLSHWKKSCVAPNKKYGYVFNRIPILYLPSNGSFESLARGKKQFDYTGEWENGCFHGYGTLTTAKGTYTGEFVKGKRHGKGRFVDTAGNVQEGIWEKDKLVETKKL